MSKCDFCDKPSVGYTFQQINFYCVDHEKKAEDISNKYQDYLDEETERFRAEKQ